jgi:hypothetical protein
VAGALRDGAEKVGFEPAVRTRVSSLVLVGLLGTDRTEGG